MNVQDILSSLYFVNHNLNVLGFNKDYIRFLEFSKNYSVDILIKNYYRILKGKSVIDYTELYDSELARGAEYEG